MEQVQYAPGHSDRELKRLTRQAEVFEPFTRRLLQRAGIESGMRILEVGSGSGDVAFLVSELVGPAGEVVGVDRAARAVDWANARAQSLGMGNVRFLEGNPAEMRFDRTFDAVVGRLVLMYCPDPIDFVRKLTGCLRNGGLVVFQEFDCENCRSCPPAATYDQAANWIRASLMAGGARLRLGLELFGIYVAAGLPEPSLVMEASIGGGRGCPAYQMIAEIVETLLPLIEKHRIATAAEVEISTLACRMRDEVVASNGVALSPALIGAWSRKGSRHGTNHGNN